MDSTRSSKPRGKACMLCRHRKIGCDTARPVCGQCRAQGPTAAEDCQYPTEGATTSQILEWSIARLERRIKELTSGQPVSDPSQNVNSPSVNREISQASSGASLETLITNFLRHKHFIFFLDEQRFLEGIRTRNSSHRPCESLLNVVCLWGALLDPRGRNLSEEQKYLARARQLLSSGQLSGSDRNQILHTVQAGVLLSTYYLNAGNRLESGYWANTAASLAIGANLHSLGRSSAQTQRSSWTAQTTSLPPPENAEDEAERIRAFWACFILTHELTLDSVPTLLTPPYIDISTPWPEEGKSGAVAGDGTLTRFLQNSGQGEGTSPMALHVKASILFSRAVSVLKMSRNVTPSSPNFIALDTLVDTFKRGFPTSYQAIAGSHDLLLAFSLLQAASIRINAPFAHVNEESRNKCFAAAFQTVRAIELCGASGNGMVFIQPMLGLLWAIVADVVLTHIAASREVDFVICGVTERESVQSLDVIVNCLERFSERSSLLRQYVHHIREEFLKMSTGA